MSPISLDPRKFRYAKHEVFETPPEDTQLARYMTLTKFLALIEGGYLFFARYDKLGDPFEGSWPKSLVKAWFSQVEDEHRRYAEVRDREAGKAEPVVMAMFQNSRVLRACSAASCWHEWSGESAALWQHYSSSDSGLCVRTTVGQLRQLLDRSGTGDAEVAYHLGRVRYIDYDNLKDPSASNTYWPLIYKWESFNHEKEVRAVIIDYASYPSVEERGLRRGGIQGGGLAIPVFVADLITEVIVAPQSAGWVADTVMRVAEKLGHGFPVRPSVMARRPLI